MKFSDSVVLLLREVVKYIGYILGWGLIILSSTVHFLTPCTKEYKSQNFSIKSEAYFQMWSSQAGLMSCLYHNTCNRYNVTDLMQSGDHFS